MTPTSEQLAIIKAATSSDENLIINALAGAAKTSTLILIAQALAPLPILSLAFGRKIAEEMKERLPPSCTASTLHSLGLSAWKRRLGRFPKIDKTKTSRLWRRFVDSLSSEDERTLAWEFRSEILDGYSYAKGRGFSPLSKAGLLSEDALFEALDPTPTPFVCSAVLSLTKWSEQEALDGTLDYDDMVLLPVLYPCSFDFFPLILIDEAQDLSSLNHALLKKVAKKRLIAVGDPCQAIYGFRGAHEESMAIMQRDFSMRSLTLSISFRCAQEIVRAAQWRAPQMKWPEWAKPGEVRSLETWSVDDLPEYAAIICRNNAPIFFLALRLIRAGRFPTLPRNDIGLALIKILEKFGQSTLSQENCLTKLQEWTTQQLKRSKSPEAVHDKADCLRIFIEAGETLGQAIAFAKDLLARSGTLEMMTVHKAKGLEWEEVFILDSQLISNRGQDPNLRYVAQTRAKARLTYLTSTGFEGAPE